MRCRVGIAGALLLAAALGCDGGGPTDEAGGGQALTYDFRSDAQGWVADFADYPRGEEDFYELDSGTRALPAPLDPKRKAVYLAGNNHSDDLFMFLKRKVTGLAPRRSYRVGFQVEIATSAGTGCLGVGGSPGEGVYVKGGASAQEPTRTLDSAGWYRLVVDKGNQAEGGRDAVTLGTIAGTSASCDGKSYELKTLRSDGKGVEVTTDADGALWLLVGFDSAFEGATRVYVTGIGVSAEPR